MTPTALTQQTLTQHQRGSGAGMGARRAPASLSKRLTLHCPWSRPDESPSVNHQSVPPWIAVQAERLPLWSGQNAMFHSTSGLTSKTRNTYTPNPRETYTVVPSLFCMRKLRLKNVNRLAQKHKLPRGGIRLAVHTHLSVTKFSV